MHSETHSETPSETHRYRETPASFGTPDVRALIGRKPRDAPGRSQELLQEIRRLRHRAASGDGDRDGIERLLLILGLLAAHGPREDRLLCYQLRQMGDQLRRRAGIWLAG